MNKTTKNIIQYIFTVVIISFSIYLSIRSLLHEGFFRTIDDISPIRIEYLAKELSELSWNNFPVRMSSYLAHGHGYLLYLFYSPLSYYGGAILMLFGKLSSIVATKAVYAFPLVLGPILFYFAAKEKLTNNAALIATVAFALFPFRGWDIYTRGGVGESWAIAFIPLILLGLFRIQSKKQFGVLLTGIGLGLTIISHNISGLIAFGFAIIIALVFRLKFRQVASGICLGIMLSAFFWLPMAWYLDIVKVNSSAQNSGYVLTTLAAAKDILFDLTPFSNGRPYSPHLFFPFLLWLVLILIRRITSQKSIVPSDVYKWIFITFGLYLLISKESILLWQLTLPVTRLVQFSWRVFIVLSIAFPIAYGYMFDSLKKVWLQAIYAAAIIVLITSYLVAFSPKEYSYYYNYRADETGPCAVSWGEEYLPVWADKCFDSPSDKLISLSAGQADVISQTTSKNNHYLVIDVKTESANIVVNKYYYPGWEVVENNEKKILKYPANKNGAFEFMLPHGTHYLSLRYNKTTVMIVADLITTASLVGIFIYLIFKIRNIKSK